MFKLILLYWVMKVLHNNLRKNSSQKREASQEDADAANKFEAGLFNREEFLSRGNGKYERHMGNGMTLAATKIGENDWWAWLKDASGMQLQSFQGPLDWVLEDAKSKVESLQDQEEEEAKEMAQDFAGIDLLNF